MEDQGNNATTHVVWGSNAKYWEETKVERCDRIGGGGHLGGSVGWASDLGSGHDLTTCVPALHGALC